MPEAVGADVFDGSGKAHLGIITFPVPILRGDAEQIRSIRETLYGDGYQDVIVADFPMWPNAAKTTANTSARRRGRMKANGGISGAAYAALKSWSTD